MQTNTTKIGLTLKKRSIATRMAAASAVKGGSKLATTVVETVETGWL